MLKSITKHRWFPLGTVMSLYVSMVIIVTFPFILHPASTLTAPVGGDVASSAAKYQGIIHAGGNPFKTTTINSVAYPEGINNNIGVDRVAFLSVLSQWSLSLLTNPIMAQSLLTISGYLLTAIVTFLFIRRATGSTSAAAIGGFILAFSPHMYSIGRAASSYTHIWLLVLPIWAFWRLTKSGPSSRGSLLAGLSVIPAVFWTPYFALHALVVAASSLLVTGWLWRNKYRGQQWWQPLLVIIVGWMVMMASYWYLGTHSPSTEVPMRTLEQAYEQAAHPLMYLLPGHFSWWGGTVTGWLAPNILANSWLVQHVPYAAFTNLYVGATVLILALLSGLAFKKSSALGTNQNRNIKILTAIAGVVTLSSFAFSLPPTVDLLGKSWPTPNWVVVNAVPALRAGQRFVMPLMGALAVLAALGVYQLLQRVRSHLRWMFVTLILLIVGLDLWALPPESATVIKKSPALAVLANQPIAPAAYFQRSSLISHPAQSACLLQHQHQQPLLNDCGLDRSLDNPHSLPPTLALLESLPLCSQLTELQKLGARYVIFEQSNHKIGQCLKTSKLNYSLLATDKNFVVMAIQ